MRFVYLNMRIIFSYLFCMFAFVACVPVAKYNMVQNELRNSLNANILSQTSNKSLQLILDSTRNSILDFKSDYNSLSFELEDIQRSSIFSDRDLLKQLNLVRAEHKTLLNSINQAQARSEYAVWLSNERANSFSKDAKCELEIYSKNNFLLVNKNIVLLDLEGLLGTSTEHQAEFKKALVELIKPLQNRNDWNMRVCLYQGGLQPEWTSTLR